MCLNLAEHEMVLNHPTARTAMRHFACKNIPFSSMSFLESIFRLQAYPLVSVQELIDCAALSGVELVGFHSNVEQLSLIELPVLTYLRSERTGLTIELAELVSKSPTGFKVRRNHALPIDVCLDELNELWTGIALNSASFADNEFVSEINEFRRTIRETESFIDESQCQNILGFCQTAEFVPSLLGSRAGRSGQVYAKDTNLVRSSSSLYFDRANSSLLNPVIESCCRAEGVTAEQIECVQCVRYRQGERYLPHIDNSLQTPRLTTFIVYLNDDFHGGETLFPLLGLFIAPKRGKSLRFCSADAQGRSFWASEHAGQPVINGVKYALNVWVMK